MACGGPRSEADAPADPPSAASAPADTLPPRFVRTLAGTIGGDSVEVGLRLEEGMLGGWVAAPEWDGRGFSGPVGEGGALVLEVWNQEGTPTDTLVGTLGSGAQGMVLRGHIRGGGRAPRAVDLREKRTLLASGAALVSRDVSVRDSAAGWYAYGQLPVLLPPAGGRLAPGEAAFNDAADALVRQEIFGFAQHVEPPEDLPSDYDGPRLSSFEEGFELTLADAGLLSMEFGISVFHLGAAHPMYYTRTLTWDLTRGRAVELAEIFRPDADPLPILSRYAIAAIEKSLGEFAENAWVAHGAGPDAANYGSWTLTPEGLRVVFDPYQVAPYAAGTQEVVVPWSALAWILDPAGPAARLSR